MAELDIQPKLMVGEGWADFALLDSGNGRKLERYGKYRFIRPEPQAMWSPMLPDWQADAEFVPGSDEDGGGRWQYNGPVPRDGWELGRGDVRFQASCTPFRHLGFFPDMAPVWDWMAARLEGKADAQTLNLFGYTGVGTLSLSDYGPVTHVDASKKSVAQARVNAELSGMTARPVRWIVDDAAKFAAREVRRTRRYDGIILDPPKFGRGPDGEVWRLEEHLPNLIADCAQLLDAESRFLFLTVYAVRMSSLAIAGLLAEALKGLPGTIEHGDLSIREEGCDGRLLPTAIFARWKN
ncbi:class I SAM-dependent methyltransferase [Novosphingobium sp. CECT 9465]|uniref:class I SAM-dependent methyltransferase n=1 Tax=Novosphingobium sp. CECT 9465 TaxID=2829794 RepID=UPI001E63B06D|nr:class I SAM-dependent methyltransferase [Novosphingobium sp. CECT 9465]CAH0497494.1 Ribosomal RNA large subunit methyltransferase K/L [Novosphingobium sp. CECT 9465]